MNFAHSKHEQVSCFFLLKKFILLLINISKAIKTLYFSISLILLIEYEIMYPPKKQFNNEGNPLPENPTISDVKPKITPKINSFLLIILN